MKVIHYTSVMAVCGALVACGGSKKPVVEPAPVADTVAVKPAAPAKVTLDNPTDRYSYALGMDLGKAIANINVPLNMDVLMGAIVDEIDSSHTVLMADSVAESSLQDLLLQMQKKKEADEKAAAQKALDVQAQVLAKNALDSTIKITTKGVQYKIIKEGTGATPKESDKVQVHYIGALLDGTEFDNSVKRGEPLEFPVKAVIEGWQDLLLVLKEGEKVKAWIPSALAYGEAGVQPIIPANSMLVFEVELLKVLTETVPDSVANVQQDAATDSLKVAPADTSAKADTAAVAPAVENAKVDSAKSETAKPENVKPEQVKAKKADTKPAAKPNKK